MALIDVLRARRRVRRFVRRTPLVESGWLSGVTGGRIFMKLESLQVSNSFKARGAFNAVARLLERSATQPGGLVTASAGNHGRALAMAARAFSLPLVVFTPSAAPRTKLDAIRREGATLRAEACDYDESERMAKAYAVTTGALFVSPYNHQDIIDGAATIGLELLEEVPEVDTIVVPIGGGGLISGIASAVKRIKPDCRVVGVEAGASCAFQTSVRAGRLVKIVPGPTLADGLEGNPDPDTMTFPIIQQFVDDIVTVSEDEIRTAICGLAGSEHLISEGAGAVGIAALLSKRIPVDHRAAATIISGGNIDLATLNAVLAVAQRAPADVGA